MLFFLSFLDALQEEQVNKLKSREYRLFQALGVPRRFRASTSLPPPPLSPSSLISMEANNDIKALHRLIRFISGLAVTSFFTEVRVIGGENVPKTGPIIVYVVSCSAFPVFKAHGCYRNSTATHHNMMLDPVVLCAQTCIWLINSSDFLV